MAVIMLTCSLPDSRSQVTAARGGDASCTCARDKLAYSAWLRGGLDLAGFYFCKGGGARQVWFCSLICESEWKGYADGVPSVSFACGFVRGGAVRVVLRVGVWVWSKVRSVDAMMDAVLAYSSRTTHNTQCFNIVVPAYPCGLGATETSLGLVRFADFIWDWQDEPESLILAQSERWRHA